MRMPRAEQHTETVLPAAGLLPLHSSVTVSQRQHICRRRTTPCDTSNISFVLFFLAASRPLPPLSPFSTTAFMWRGADTHLLRDLGFRLQILGLQQALRVFISPGGRLSLSRRHRLPIPSSSANTRSGGGGGGWGVARGAYHHAEHRSVDRWWDRPGARLWHTARVHHRSRSTCTERTRAEAPPPRRWERGPGSTGPASQHGVSVSLPPQKHRVDGMRVEGEGYVAKVLMVMIVVVLCWWRR